MQGEHGEKPAMYCASRDDPMPDAKPSSWWPGGSWLIAGDFSWDGIAVRSVLRRGLLDGMLYDGAGA